MIYMLLFKKVPMATWRSRKPQARHRVKYPRCCQWWLMSSSRLKFHERDFARRHRRGESIPFVLGRQSPRKLHGFLLIQHVTRKKKKIGFLRWRLNDRGRQESGRGRMRLRETPCLDHPRPCGQPDSLVVPTSSLITSSVLHCDTMSLQNRTSVEPSDRREEDMSSNNAIKKTAGRQYFAFCN